MFEQSFLPAAAKTRRVWTVALSSSAQVVAVGVLVIIPLLVTDRLPVQLRQPLMPPPRGRSIEPKPQHVQVVGVQRLAPQKPGVFTAPTWMPAKARTIVDPPQAQTAGEDEGVVGGMPLTGAQIDPALRKIITSVPQPPAPPVTTTPKSDPVIPRIRRGGEVQNALLMHKVIPAYPALAKQARVSGVVQLSAIIGADGRIRELQVLSGPALLVNAAVEAVRQWTYRPTLLNGEAVEVVTTIDVTFTLTQ